MAKRTAELAVTEAQPYNKRQKVVPAVATSKHEITSARHLKQLTTFVQDANQGRLGLQAFKSYLDGLNDPETRTDAEVSLLRDFLRDQDSPVPTDDQPEDFLPDIMKTWSFAAQSNDERLLSACPALLALLLRTLDSHLELLDFGRKLCRTLLESRQLQLLSRGTSASKEKQHLISPAIRLLRQIAMFDGGTFAKQVFRTRHLTLKNIARNLNLRLQNGAVETERKQSIRSQSVRLILALVKFLPTPQKRELLSQHEIALALTKDIQLDRPALVLEVIETLKTHVLMNADLHKDVKSKFLYASALARLAQLYGYDEQGFEGDESKPDESVEDRVHAFLQLICTTSDTGILRDQHGYYPRGVDPRRQAHDSNSSDSIDGGVNDFAWVDKFQDSIPVMNTTLSEFVQNLKPWAFQRQSELILEIFTKAPELIAPYFYGKRDFSYEPKLTPVWMGLSAFTFSALQFPIPPFFGHAGGYAPAPPPYAVVLENLLPLPLSQKLLTKALMSSENLISYFAMRILCEALQKLQSALKMYQEASMTFPLWAEAATQLRNRFILRCPSVQSIINCFQAVPESDSMQRGAITRLLVLYYQTIPGTAIDASFDVSNRLATTLRAARESPDVSTDDLAANSTEIHSLFELAQYTSGMRWFTKVDGVGTSSFVALLQFIVEPISSVESPSSRNLLRAIALENQILQGETATEAVDVLIAVAKQYSGDAHSRQMWSFLDNCIARCAANPLKYILMIEEWRATLPPRDEWRPLSLLVPTMAEQWKHQGSDHQEFLARFVASFLALSGQIGEDPDILKTSKDQIIRESDPKLKLAAIFKRIKPPSLPSLESSNSNASQKTSSVHPEAAADQSSVIVLELPSVVEDHAALTKWAHKEVLNVVDDGHLGALMQLLCSPVLHIRKETLTGLQKFASLLKSSNYDEKDQVWLLLSELIETARPSVDQAPLSTVHAAFSSAATSVLSDPLHALYAKVNEFLSMAPTWDRIHVPLLSKILDGTPTLDDARFTELSWLLDMLFHGLRTPSDLDLYRHRRVFERLLSLYANVYVGDGLKKKIIKVVHAATGIEGGGTTLVTRCSIMAWLDAELAMNSSEKLQPWLQALRKGVLDTRDRERILTWSGQDIDDETAG